MRQLSLRLALLLIGWMLLPNRVAAQEARFFTTTGVSLAFPVGTLRQATQNGRGTTVNIEYRLRPRFSVVGAWDSNVLPVQSARLLVGLDLSLRGAVTTLKGDYTANTLGVYGIYYGPQRSLRPYLLGGAGVNVITVPTPTVNEQTRQLSLESTSVVAFFGSAGIGLNWQFSKPVAFFGEASAYWVPAASLVSSGANSYLTTKMGLRFPLF